MRQRYLQVTLLLMALCSMAACGTKPEVFRQEAITATAEEATEYSGCSAALEEMSRQEAFEKYEEYGLVYDKEKDELIYCGKLVRWFQDYYPLGEGMTGGIDFLDENGTVDVYARRDISQYERNADGSYDPAGKLMGLEEFSQEEFDERDIEAHRNLQEVSMAFSSGEELTIEELRKQVEEYAPFGVTYNLPENQWYFNGEAVRTFRDVLSSNGESPSGGNFKGTLRMMCGKGTIDICTVRDYSRPKEDGTGTLIDIKECDLQ